MITINYDQWLLDFLPPTRRTQRTIDWLKVFYNEIQNEYDWIMDYFDETNYEIKHNSQIMSLEHYINDKLQPSGGTVYVSRDADFQSDIYNYIIQDHLPSIYETYIYKVIENIFKSEQVFLYNTSESGSDVYLFSDEEFEIDLVDFDIALKTSDYNNATFKQNLETKIEQFRLAGLTYELYPY